MIIETRTQVTGIEYRTNEENNGLTVSGYAVRIWFP